MKVVFVPVAIIIILLAVSAVLEKYFPGLRAVPRKILHIGAISVCASSVYIIPQTDYILIAAGAALPFTFAAVWFGFLKDKHTGRRSWGMVYFIAVFLALTYFFGATRPELVFYPMAVLALADGFATLAGEYLGMRRYTLGGDERSHVGSAVFFLLAAGILLFAGRLFSAVPLPESATVYLIFIAVFLTVTEAASSSGRDNIWVPSATAYWLATGSATDLTTEAILWPLLLAAAAYLAFRKKWLSAGGAAAAALMGAVFLVSPAPIYFLPPLIFFGAGTLLSLLPGPRGDRHEEPPRRTAVQVWANGGPGTAALMLWMLTDIDALALASVAGFSAALSDTASSEIGSRFSRKAWSAVGLKKLEAGVSGGISLPGSLAGILFAGVIPLAAVSCGLASLPEATAIAVISVLSNYADSIAGQFLQEKNLRTDGTWTDTDRGDSRGVRAGWSGMTNDAVNALAVSWAVILTAAFFMFRA